MNFLLAKEKSSTEVKAYVIMENYKYSIEKSPTSNICGALTNGQVGKTGKI